MPFLLTISHHTSVRIAEVAFLLILIAGIWLVVAELLPSRLHKLRTVVAGIALAVAGLLLLIASHWGHFG
jgi:hypothetical protein